MSNYTRSRRENEISENLLIVLEVEPFCNLILSCKCLCLLSG